MVLQGMMLTSLFIVLYIEHHLPSKRVCRRACTNRSLASADHCKDSDHLFMACCHSLTRNGMPSVKANATASFRAFTWRPCKYIFSSAIWHVLEDNYRQEEGTFYDKAHWFGVVYIYHLTGPPIYRDSVIWRFVWSNNGWFNPITSEGSRGNKTDVKGLVESQRYSSLEYTAL